MKVSALLHTSIPVIIEPINAIIENSLKVSVIIVRYSPENNYHQIKEDVAYMHRSAMQLFTTP